MIRLDLRKRRDRRWCIGFTNFIRRNWWTWWYITWRDTFTCTTTTSTRLHFLSCHLCITLFFRLQRLLLQIITKYWNKSFQKIYRHSFAYKLFQPAKQSTSVLVLRAIILISWPSLCCSCIEFYVALDGGLNPISAHACCLLVAHEYNNNHTVPALSNWDKV